MPRNILVTGGFGFIGTSLVERLVQDGGARIHVVDNLSTSPVDLDYFLDEIGHPSNLTFDITSVSEFFHRSPSQKWEQIYHLASPVGPAGVLKHAGNMIRDVVHDAYLIIDYCLSRDCKLLDVSTSEIYGGGQSGYCSEATTKIVPPRTTIRLEYAIAKLAVETALINTCHTRNLKATIVRPFNVAGPRQSPKGGFVLPRFIRQACRDKPLTVFGDGSAIRAFTHVNDMVSGFILAMEKGRNGEAYNIGNPANKTTILQFAHWVTKCLGSRSQIVFIDPKTIYGPTYEEANDKFPDAEKARTELGWEPVLDIESVIIDCWKDYRRQLSSRRIVDVE
jgi:nucleoside-diphosphate-sugar epimerase